MSTSTARPHAPLRSPLNLAVLVARLGTALGLERQILQGLSRSLLPREYLPLKNYKPTKHDVFVATYAKSGTNWAMQICYQIAHRGAGTFDHIHDVVSWPESKFPEVVAFDDPTPQRCSPTGLRIIKTHLPVLSVPYHPDAKYITVIRDPKDVLISAYHFMLGMLGVRHKISMTRWLELCLVDDSIAKKWVEHTVGFWAWRERPNVFVRTFSQFKQHHRDYVTQIAAMLGVELDDDELAAVLERSSFAHMREHKQKFAPPRSRFAPAAHQPDMIRRGKARESRETMTDEQQRRFDNMFRTELSRVESDFPYDTFFGPS